MPEARDQRSVDVAAVSALDEPNRRRLYDYVRDQCEPVTRDDAADALQMPRQTAAFHLDKLAEVGLLEVEFARRSGRTGPGAGRPAKFYRRGARDIAVSLPERSYELAGLLLAEAIEASDASGASPRQTLSERARELGRELGSDAGSSDDDLLATLSRCGYEPRVEGDEVALVNCPFRALARTHTDLVCGMNLALVEGLVDGSGADRGRVRLAPRAGYCCVRIAVADSPAAPAQS